MRALAPGGVVGVLGGGQLGRMLAIAAAQLGFDAHIYVDHDDSPAARVSARATVGDYHDHAALAAFARSVDVVTTEFENVPADTAQALIDAGAIVRPNPRALAIAQDRLLEKTFLNSLGIATAAYAAIDAVDDLDVALARIGAPMILKTRRMGYDGKGQARVATPDAALAAFESFGRAPCILEGVCAFEAEVSMIAARSADGDIRAYDLVENAHAGGILVRSTPARASADVAAQAQAACRAVLEALDYVGVLTIEFFVMPDGALVANEIAPRVHNSGHWTIEAAATSQFEQHIRAVAGWPLGATDALFAWEMINLIGDDAARWAELAHDGRARLHLYGKRDAPAGRKMGHVTRRV
ncbi:MAG: 5-(carboxyamino)imidazole ribonucleotide synthase [Hyphomonadaceae bacterium]|nr:5-(carboxyamino)imidazole ribonucleotide synthase [Hyphomonadaceae bacterium]